MPIPPRPSGFEALLETMRRLRSPEGGCPWDLEQTHASLRDTLIEESYEALEALDGGEPGALVEELGDLLLQIIFHAQIGADEGAFDMADVVAHLNEKLIRRHPHVFGEGAAATATDVTGQWERIKAAERAGKGQGERSMLDGVPRAMPALGYAGAVLARARRAGFDWDGDEGAFAKVAEEAVELRDAPEGGEREREFGDLLQALVGAGLRMGLDAEQALRGANARFATRFARMERGLRERGEELAGLPEAERLAHWEQAKAAPDA
jgi:tetrapyrrole methylase family protein/MazG family protein